MMRRGTHEQWLQESTARRADTSLFDVYVRSRLDAWGREFRLDRPLPELGHQSRNILAVLIEHHGEIPERAIGFKPLSIPVDAMQVEDVVTRIHAEAPAMAWVLRCYYGSGGRVAQERYMRACQLAHYAMSRRQFFTLHDLGFNRVAGALSALAKTA